ncbi:unnamed protein product [Paramecium sonneborni]|uniref:Uncharacterized protein n=1 Tax=Paramecium sonneborni TaxID=65129 RepID=A0A8S1M6K4_9CILI|nr:unnamed protein product [Paramecium sonneborni]
MKSPQQYFLATALGSLVILIIMIYLMVSNMIPIYGGLLIILPLAGINTYLFYIVYQNNYVDSLKKMMLIGMPGVGKTFLYNYLQCKTIQKQKNFQIGTFQELCIIDSPDLDLESQKREIRIKEFQNIFIKFQNSICALLLIVNFERTDLMKSKKFSPLIFLIITDFDKSDNQTEDQKNLKESFKLFQLKKIIFLDKKANKQELYKELLQIQKEMPNALIDLKDTIFEKLDAEDEEKYLEQFKNKMNSQNDLGVTFLKN